MDRVGSRPTTGARTRVVSNGAANGAVTNGSRAKTNGAISHRPGTNGTTKVLPVVTLIHVKKAFGNAAGLKEINLSGAPGELVEIIGPSGAGKTTLLRLVHGQLRPTGGEVWVEGRGLHRRWRRGLGRIRRNVAFIFQEQRLLPRLTAIENIMLALQVRDPQVPRRAITQRAL